MDDLLVIPGVVIPDAELIWRFDASGGPGGQHANKSATRAELRFDIGASGAFTDEQRRRVLQNLGSAVDDGVLTVQSADSRSQWRNRQIAKRRLVETLREGLKPPPPVRKRTKPTRASRERRLADKRSRSETKRLRRRPIQPD